MSCRNICTVDWLKRNPGGKTREFNWYWDHKINSKEKPVRETIPPYMMYINAYIFRLSKKKKWLKRLESGSVYSSHT